MEFFISALRAWLNWGRAPRPYGRGYYGGLDGCALGGRGRAAARWSRMSPEATRRADLLDYCTLNPPPRPPSPTSFPSALAYKFATFPECAASLKIIEREQDDPGTGTGWTCRIGMEDPLLGRTVSARITLIKKDDEWRLADRYVVDRMINN